MGNNILHGWSHLYSPSLSIHHHLPSSLCSSHTISATWSIYINIFCFRYNRGFFFPLYLAHVNVSDHSSVVSSFCIPIIWCYRVRFFLMKPVIVRIFHFFHLWKLSQLQFWYLSKYLRNILRNVCSPLSCKLNRSGIVCTFAYHLLWFEYIPQKFMC